MLKDTQAAGERVMQYANIPSCDKTQGQDPFYIRLHEHCTFIINCQYLLKFSKKERIDDFHCIDQTVLYQLLVSITSSRYWGDSYPYLLRIKKQWDPDNIFNHCQSLGSEEELCCPWFHNAIMQFFIKNKYFKHLLVLFYVVYSNQFFSCILKSFNIFILSSKD